MIDIVHVKPIKVDYTKYYVNKCTKLPHTVSNNVDIHWPITIHMLQSVGH